MTSFHNYYQNPLGFPFLVQTETGEVWRLVTMVVLFLKVKNDHRSKFSNLSNWNEEAWKKSGLQRDSNPWPPHYPCVALPTELWSHTLGARSIYWVQISREEWNDVKYIWNNSFLNFGCRWKWRLLLSNCLNWKIYCDDHSSLSYTTAVQKKKKKKFHIYFTSFDSSREIWTQ